MIEGNRDFRDLHVGIAVANWNQSVTDRLLDGAVGRCEELGVGELTTIRVPGSLELPLATLKLAEMGCDAVVAIGVVVKGDTDHYEIVVRESTSGVSRVALDTGVPVGNAILAVHDIEHAAARAQSGEANKGVEAVDAAIDTANALRQLGDA